MINGDEDLIGTARIPLEDIQKWTSFKEQTCKIYDNKGRDNGKATISIKCQEIADLPVVPKVRDMHTLTNTDQKIDEVVNKIALALSRKTVELILLFGIFSRGSDTCTLEDFKYNCLQRLNLGGQIDIEDFDYFLEHHPILKKVTASNKDVKQHK